MRREDLLDLNDVLQHPGRKVAVDISTELSDEADIDLMSPLVGYLEAVSTGNILLITGEFTTRAVVECARCTEPLEKDLTFEIDEQFAVEGVPSSLSQQDFAKVVADEPYQLFEENSLIVEALLRQTLLLSLPLQPLCEYGWDGPCPVATQRGVSTLRDRPGGVELGGLSKFLRTGDRER
ncbi:MAG: YceD family protein [Fimbriimonadales bacterium]